MKKILFTGGGTLGHIYPAISFIRKIKEKYPNTYIIYFATTKDQKYSVLKEPLIDEIYYFEVSGIPTNKLKIFKAFIKNVKAYNKMQKIIKQNEISLCIGMGGYISGITIMACNRNKIPAVIHEQNSRIGFANKLVLNKVDKIFTSFENTIVQTKYESKIECIGNPRYDIAKMAPQSKYRNKYQILITSGSLGSKVINDIAIGFLNSDFSKKFTTTLITGSKYYDDVIKNVLPGNHYQIKPFSDQMLKEMGLAGIVISRAGSTTLFEILALKCAAIVIPSPNVTNNHQYYNAKSLEEKGLIYMLEETALKDNLEKALADILKKYDEIMMNLDKYTLNNVSDSFLEKIKLYIEGD